jgi:hypothetical protein
MRERLAAQRSLFGDRGIAQISRVAAQSALTPTELAPPATRRMIRRGSSGFEVRYAQERLNDHISAALAVDGLFGPLTQAATRDYQHTHGLTSDAIIGPRTWASLDGPADVLRSGSGAGGGAGGKGSAVLLYDQTAVTFNAPSSSFTMAGVSAQLKTKQTAGDLGPTVSVPGVKAGSNEERFLWNALFQRGAVANWGSELDAITAIGPAPAGGTAPLGRITIRIDGAGNATAVLVATGGLTASTRFADADKAKAALIKDFGFKSVDDVSGTWTLPHLTIVYEALAKMPTADRAALAGVKLVRESTIVEDGESLNGQFIATQRVTGTTTVDERLLRIADSAFQHDALSFIGDTAASGPASFATIVHEVGHAVDLKEVTEARAREHLATAAFNKANDDANAAGASSQTAQIAAITAFNGYKPADQASGRGYATAVRAAHAAINTFGMHSGADEHPKSEAAASQAIATRDTRKGKLATTHPALTDFAAWSGAEDAWFAAAQTRASRQAASEAAKKDTAAQTATIGTTTGSKRLKAFVDFVNANKIPRLTAYAEKNWPSKPKEFFAEAYTLWLNDPDYLNSQAPLLKAWFDAGKHRV